MAVGQGFNGGLPALVRHFGADVAPDAEPATPVPHSQAAQPAPPASSISLEKRVEAKAPQLVSLGKSAGVSLAEVGLQAHRARVRLVLDISGSMSTLYRKGLVQRFAERILPLGAASITMATSTSSCSAGTSIRPSRWGYRTGRATSPTLSSGIRSRAILATVPPWRRYADIISG